MNATLTIPTEIADPINARILSVSEDQVSGYQRRPLVAIARQSGVELATVIERISAMLRAGTIRRVRQTLLAMNLAPGSLVAWQVPEPKLQAAFDWMFRNDPFSGHVVIRSTDTADGTRWRLWTTLKVPLGYSMQRHCDYLCQRTGATKFKLMPAKRLFALGVGHVRRRGVKPGEKSESLAEVMETSVVRLNDLQWQVLTALKREFKPEEVRPDLWEARAEEAGVDSQTFHQVAGELDELGVIGRFSTFLEHVKPLNTGERVTRFNALFHWAIPQGREIEAGREMGRFHIMTHAYWREGGPDFNNVNLMGVAHGLDKDLLLEHKAAIDAHLEQVGIPVSYTSVFWGGRSEIKPSEIAPSAYADWCRREGIDPQTMRE
jgi:DNA-binding Lrp family transcriptional regulator